MIKRFGSRLSALGAIAFVLVPFASTQAQAFSVGRESKVMLLGKSNISSWRCSTSQFLALANVDSLSRSVRLSVTVPVRSMDCGHSRMNDDLYRALKADSFPAIRYELTSYVIDVPGADSDSVLIHSVGSITVAGRTQRVEIPVRAERRINGLVAGQGSVRILMTDFGIKPPTAFFGAIRAKNALEVRIEAEVTEPTFATARRTPSR
jgi:polyisoprenoid-binding protein YceI